MMQGPVCMKRLGRGGGMATPPDMSGKALRPAMAFIDMRLTLPLASRPSLPPPGTNGMKGLFSEL